MTVSSVRPSGAAGLEQLKLSLLGSILYVHKGWGTLVAALAGAAESNGAIIAKGQSVVSVKVEAGRATSVTLDDGTQVRCGAVIVATDPLAAPRLRGEAMPPPASNVPVCVATLDVALRRPPAKRTIFAVGIDDPVCRRSGDSWMCWARRTCRESNACWPPTSAR